MHPVELQQAPHIEEPAVVAYKLALALAAAHKLAALEDTPAQGHMKEHYTPQAPEEQAEPARMAYSQSLAGKSDAQFPQEQTHTDCMPSWNRI